MWFYFLEPLLRLFIVLILNFSIESSIVIMTPYVWICDQSSTQTLLVDLISAELKSDTNVRLNISLRSVEDNSTVKFNLFTPIESNESGFHRVDFQVYYI